MVRKFVYVVCRALPDGRPRPTQLIFGFVAISWTASIWGRHGAALGVPAAVFFGLAALAVHELSGPAEALELRYPWFYLLRSGLFVFFFLATTSWSLPVCAAAAAAVCLVLLLVYRRGPGNAFWGRASAEIPASDQGV